MTILTYGLAAALAVSAAGLGWQTVRLEKERAGRASDSRAYADERTKAANAYSAELARVLAEHQATQSKLEQIQTEGEARHAELAEKSAALERANHGLRGSLTIALDAIGRKPGEEASVTAGCAPAREAAGVLADMHARMAEAGSRVSGFADQAFDSGQRCVSSYEVIR